MTCNLQTNKQKRETNPKCIEKIKYKVHENRRLSKHKSGDKRSSADAEKPARRDIIWREEKYRLLICRRTAVSYAEGVLTYRQAEGSYSVSDRKFLSPPE